MKNKVLITGLGVGNELDICQACNGDFTWLINNPSVLLWADKIYITQKIWEAINDPVFIRDKKDLKAINIIMNIADSEGIIEVINPLSIFDESYADKLVKQVEKDVSCMLSRFPSVTVGDEQVPGEIIVDGYEYCFPYIGTIYLSLSLAEHLDANCLFNKRVLNFLNYKFGLDLPKGVNSKELSAFEEIFLVTIPDELSIHNYAFCNDDMCNQCKNILSCKENYLFDIEKNIRRMLQWRNYDEIYQIKEVINFISTKIKQVDDDYYIEDLKQILMKKAYRINKNILKVFPRIQRWTSLATIISVPVSIGSLALGNQILSVASAGLAGVSKITDEYIKYYSNKHRWVGFINK